MPTCRAVGLRVLHHTLVFQDRIWVMGGQTPAPIRPAAEVVHGDIWNTDDGVRWLGVVPEGPSWSPGGMIGGSAVHRGPDVDPRGRHVRHARASHGQYFNDVWSSADGIHWAPPRARPLGSRRQYHEVAAFDDRLWVLEGYARRNLNDVWHSADGEHWESLPGTPWAPRHAASVFVFKDALWVVAGNNMQPDVWKLVRVDHAGQEAQRR